MVSAVIAVAIFATVLPAKESTAAILTVLIVGDVIACWHYRRDPDWSLIRRLLPAVVPGLVLGTLFLRVVDDDDAAPLDRRRCCSCSLAAPAVGQGRGDGDEPSTVHGIRSPRGGRGPAMGFATMTANAAGPVMTLYLSAAGIDKRRFVGTSAWFFLIVNLAKVPFSIGLGLIHADDVVRAVVLSPAVLVGGAARVRDRARDQPARASTWRCCWRRRSRPGRSCSPELLGAARVRHVSRAARGDVPRRHDLRRRVHRRRGAGQQAVRPQQLGEGRPQVRPEVVVEDRGEDAGAQEGEVVAVEVVADEGHRADPGGRERPCDTGVAAAHGVDGCHAGAGRECGGHGPLGRVVVTVDVADGHDPAPGGFGGEPVPERVEPLLLAEEAAVAQRREHGTLRGRRRAG